MKLILSVFILVWVFLSSCRSRDSNDPVVKTPGKAEMEELNRYLVAKDRELIRNYVEQKGLDMTESSTGFWYHIERSGEGDLFRDGDRLSMEYNCSLLDGTLCYSSDSLGPQEVTIGRSSIPSGLNEGLKLLKPGGKAIFILPPFLAYGFVGDGRKIPQRSIIIYEVSANRLR